jgi:beta-glucanase (GH16 family)
MERLAPPAAAMLMAIGLTACQWDWDRFETPTPTGPAAEDLQLTFREECDGQSIDPKKWNTTFVAPNRSDTFRRYDWSGSWVLDENVGIANGYCSLKLTNVAVGDALFGAATLDSTNKFEQKYGYFETRVKVMRGKGLSTSIALASATAWPPQVNFVDVVGGEIKTARFVAWYKDPALAETQVATADTATTDLAADFHTYGVDWTPTNLTFYVDGKAKASLPKPAAFLTGPMRLQFVVHAAIKTGDQPDATTMFPATLMIDWVRAYQRKPSL